VAKLVSVAATKLAEILELPCCRENWTLSGNWNIVLMLFDVAERARGGFINAPAKTIPT
jgi:hypothetical protein